jgi:hypothetical protein
MAQIGDKGVQVIKEMLCNIPGVYFSCDNKYGIKHERPVNIKITKF